MSEFLDFQAEESDISRTSSDTDSSEPRRKKAKKMKEKRKKRARISDDEEEEEDDDKAIQQEMEGFVVTELSDEEQQEKSDESDSELDEELSEDDIDLVNDNLGLRTGGRIRVMEDDDDNEENQRRDHYSNRRRDDDADSIRSYDDDRDSLRSDSEAESVDNFIVDDNEDEDRRHARHKHKKARNRGFEFSSHAMEEANEVFGINSINYSSLYAEEEYENEKGTRTIRRLKSSMKKGIQLDPTELIMNNMTDEAQRIASIDAPERFIRRKRAIEECTDEELKAEALWIYENTFNKRFVTDISPTVLNNFRDTENDGIIRESERDYILKGVATVLSFIHNQKFEIPYIYTYRHESFNETTHEAKFSQNDLWEIYFADETYWNFIDRKNNLRDIMSRMEKFITHEIENGRTNLRRISNEDYDYLNRASADETLTDVQARFSLYYGPYFNKMYSWEQKENSLSEHMSEKLKVSGQYKLSSRSDLYHLALSCHLNKFAEKFGLTSDEIAVNCSTNLSNPTEARHTETDPSTEALKYTCENFPTDKHVIDGGVLLLARELASHPDFRNTMRLEYQRAALITIRCTKRGRSEIQAGHPLYHCRYITDKPISKLLDSEFLYIVHAERQGFIKYEIHVDKKCRTADHQYIAFIDSFIDKKVFYTEKMSEVAKEWNKLRAQVLTVALERFLFKVFEKELIKKMLEESTTYVIAEIKISMNKKFNFKPYQPGLQDDEDEDDDESIRHGIRIMSMVTTTKEGEATTAVILDGEGNLLDMDVFPYITNRYSEGPKRHNPNGLMQNLEKLKEFIVRKKPHAIALAGENLDSLRIKTLLRDACDDLKRKKDIRRNIFVDIVDPGVSLAYCYSDMAENEFSGQTYASKQAISLGRFFIDPLVETTHLFNYQKDFLKLKIHPLQETINKSTFIKYCVASIMNFVNKLGVDINRCIEQEHVYNMLQFVCGLGPAKASHIKKSILACEAGLATTRAVIVTVCGMGTNIYMNSSAFIKIDTVKVRERTDEMVNELDCSRVHPEHYSLAAKIASDALDMEVDADESQISAIIEEVLKKPKTLEVLNQSSLIKYLSHTEFGDTGYLVPFIIKELMDRYADPRKYIPPTADDIFKLLVHEDKSYYPLGKLVSAVFRNIAYKRLQEKDIERANGYPVHNSLNWKCRFCGSDKFYDSTSVVNHVRNEECPGNIVGLRGDLPNGISVFVPLNRIIDGCDNVGQEASRYERDDLNRKLDEAKSIANKVKKGSQLIGRIIEPVSTEKFSILLSCRPIDLKTEDDNKELDIYFDYEVYKSDIERDTVAKQTPKTAGGYFKRVIAHPHFYNVSFKQAENILSQKEPGESVIRPSSKHIDHLCVTWKVTDDIYQHVDVIEKDKPQPFSLGKTLIIDDEDYEDLEEILARYIQPMARLVRYVMDHKCYKEGIFAEEDSRLQEQLSSEKSQNPSRIPYFFVPSRKYPGKFVIAYQPRQKMLKEYFSVKPNGFRFRQQIFPTLDYMMSWFKSNFNKMPPR
ncbi:Transcription elongation factor SPT6 [Strongyloides ratti]|uniref:Suppressor of Ty 6 homolog n=1 Tax=Strongyloides ratti TaxID=34506 RepID=A0A090LBK1_STRRB|nr:Transcription elongation factor SPT6 [Strongyloides ratti]CEF64905.1 Transcription elongation factor SPT6 [Strongyloides ratti]